MAEPDPRRAFLKKVLTAGAAITAPGSLLAGPAVARPTRPQSTGIGPLDHVAVPMRNVEAMVAFYRALGFVVREGAQIVSVHFADQKINFHRPALWQGGAFALRASAAEPPCGDFCWVWEGSRQALLDALAAAGAEVEVEGERTGGRDGGDAIGQSTYVRDPDGNLLEFIRYRT